MPGEDPRSFNIEDVEQRVSNLEREILQIRSKKIGQIEVKVGSFTCPASTGNYLVTGVGFKPRVIEFTIMRAIGTSARSYIGWMDYNGNQGVNAWACDGTNANTKYSVSRCILLINDIAGIVIDAGYTSMDDDGFTINFTTIDANYKILWKATR